MTKQNCSAEAAYTNAHIAAQEMAGNLDELLHDMPAPGEDRINWSHVADLHEVNKRLAAIVEFLAGAEG